MAKTKDEGTRERYVRIVPRWTFEVVAKGGDAGPDVLEVDASGRSILGPWSTSSEVIKYVEEVQEVRGINLEPLEVVIVHPSGEVEMVRPRTDLEHHQA